MIEHPYTDRNPWLSFIINIFLRTAHMWNNQFTFSANRLKRTVVSKLQIDSMVVRHYRERHYHV